MRYHQHPNIKGIIRRYFNCQNVFDFENFVNMTIRFLINDDLKIDVMNRNMLGLKPRQQNILLPLLVLATFASR